MIQYTAIQIAKASIEDGGFRISCTYQGIPPLRLRIGGLAANDQTDNLSCSLCRGRDYTSDSIDDAGVDAIAGA